MGTLREMAIRALPSKSGLWFCRFRPGTASLWNNHSTLRPAAVYGGIYAEGLSGVNDYSHANPVVATGCSRRT